MNCLFKVLLVGMLAAVFASSPVYAEATAKPIVHFIGVSYAGNYNTITSRFPYVSAVDGFKAGAPGVLDKAVWKAFAANPPSGFRLTSGLVTDSELNDQDQAIDLTLLITNENILQTHFSINQADYYKVLAQVRAQALYFDVTKSAMVMDYPVSFTYIDVLTHPPSRADIQARVRLALLGDQNVAGLVSKFAASVSKTPYPADSIPDLLSVHSVTLAPGAAKTLGLNNADSRLALQSQIANMFSEAMSSENNVSFLPYQGNHYLNQRTIPLSISNTEVFSVKLPEPDYLFDLKLRGVKKIVFAKTGAGESLVYGAFFNVQLNCMPGDTPCLNDAGTSRTVSGNFKNGVVLKIPVTQTQNPMEDRFAYDDAMRELFTHLALAIHSKAPNGPREPSIWLASATTIPDIENQLQQTQEIFSKCR